MLGEFERCPKCKRGYMRPTAKELEDERFDLRVYLCDNDSCRTRNILRKIRFFMDED